MLNFNPGLVRQPQLNSVAFHWRGTPKSIIQPRAECVRLSVRETNFLWSGMKNRMNVILKVFGFNHIIASGTFEWM